ncbi:MAG: amidohydrolase, partial [Sphingomicrobium sp.]
PAGGKIERDAAGNPTGVFVDSAKALIQGKVPALTAAQADRALTEAQNILLGYGVTAVGAMSTSVEDWNLYRRAGDAGRLQVRLITYALGKPMKAVPHPTEWLYSDHLRMRGVKLFADGALGSRGAWLKQPYSDKPDTHGLQFHSDAELLQLADAAAAQGFQVATHAIGDAANAQVLATYEQLAKKYPGDRRWRIEHAQILDPADIKRLAPAGIIASMQPTHQTSDMNMAEARLGARRLDGAYAWRTIAASGAHLAFGSDFPVESPNPFPGIAAAVSRQNPQGQPPGGWRPEERVTLAQAVAGFTREAAYAGFAEDRLGSLDPGHWADFVLVDRDISSATPVDLAETKVFETWMGGKRVWQRSASESAPPAR